MTGPGASQPSMTLELSRADIGFSAAHFSVLGGMAERLHGHNYTVMLRARGAVGADGTVVDFHRLKQVLREACAALDERMLVPLHSDAVAVTVDGDSVHLREGSRHFVLPRDDVCLLPVSNTTCECLAVHLLQRVRNGLGDLPVRLELQVEELPGQGALAVE